MKQPAALTLLIVGQVLQLGTFCCPFVVASIYDTDSDRHPLGWRTRKLRGKKQAQKESVVLERIRRSLLSRGEELENDQSYQSRALKRTQEVPHIEKASFAKTTQYFVLYCIFVSTNGDDWDLNYGWTNVGSDPCADGWYGITCDGDVITEIGLADNGLTGMFPPEVSLLAVDGPRATGAGELMFLDISNNVEMHNGGDNSWIPMLGSDLLYLSVASTSFSGQIPHLPSGVIDFDCSFCLYSGPISDFCFKEATDLSFVVLDGNALTGRLPHTFGPFLQILSAKDASLTGILDLKSLASSSIVELRLDGNPELTGSLPTELGTWTSLRTLTLANSGITGTIPSQLGQLSRLHELVLTGTNLSGTIPSELDQLTLLKQPLSLSPPASTTT